MLQNLSVQATWLWPLHGFRAPGLGFQVFAPDQMPAWRLCALINTCCCCQVRSTIKAGSRTKRAVAGVLLSASLAHVRARRMADGLDLQYARQAPPAAAVMWAVLVAAASYPLHRCLGTSCIVY